MTTFLTDHITSFREFLTPAVISRLPNTQCLQRGAGQRRDIICCGFKIKAPKLKNSKSSIFFLSGIICKWDKCACLQYWGGHVPPVLTPMVLAVCLNWLGWRKEHKEKSSNLSLQMCLCGHTVHDGPVENKSLTDNPSFSVFTMLDLSNNAHYIPMGMTWFARVLLFVPTEIVPPFIAFS